MNSIPDVMPKDEVLLPGTRRFSRGKPMTYRQYLAMQLDCEAEKVEEFVRDSFVQVEFTTAPFYRVFRVEDLDKHFDRSARAIHYKSNDESIEGSIRLW